MYDFTSHHGNKEEKLPKKMSFSFKKSPKTIFGRLGARKQDKVAEPNGWEILMEPIERWIQEIWTSKRPKEIENKTYKKMNK